MTTIEKGQEAIVRIQCGVCGCRPAPPAYVEWGKSAPCPACGAKDGLAWRYYPVEKT